MQVNKKKRFWVWWNAVVGVILALQVSLSSCLPPEKLAAINRLEYRRNQIQLSIDALDKEISLVRTAILTKKVTRELGSQLIAGYKEKKDMLSESFSGIGNDIAEAKAANVPWWAYIPTILAAAAGVGGSIMGIKKVGTANAVASTALSAFGALSRAADASGTDGEAPAALRAGISDEIKATPGLTSSVVSELHARAKDNEI